MPSPNDELNYETCNGGNAIDLTVRQHILTLTNSQAGTAHSTRAVCVSTTVYTWASSRCV